MAPVGGGAAVDGDRRGSDVADESELSPATGLGGEGISAGIRLANDLGQLRKATRLCPSRFRSRTEA
jgi:hypothetical protein